jgi:murein DD-endopeptidase MepM/ murein hydrolase activator NlpD
LISRKKKYRFNPVTLSFEEIKTSRKQRRLTFLLYCFVALIITTLSGVLLNRYFGSQEARMLEKRVTVLHHQMQDLMAKSRNVSTYLRNEIFARDNHYRTILQIDTLPYSIRQAGAGGSALAEGLLLHYDLTYQLETMINRLDQQLEIQSGSFDAIYKKALDYSRQQTSLPAIQPISQQELIMISSNFGVRSDPFHFFEQVHNGLDFVAPVGTNVYATGDGTVTFVQHSRTGYGNEIVLDHKYGFGSRYGHLHEINVKEGESVKRGQVIGTVGQTGRATGPHLHYEVLFEHKPVNPAYYYDTSLTREEYAQIINRAKQDIN